jgi:hypothetical protein
MYTAVVYRVSLGDARARGLFFKTATDATRRRDDDDDWTSSFIVARSNATVVNAIVS